jgi:hypothetical protein
MIPKIGRVVETGMEVYLLVGEANRLQNKKNEVMRLGEVLEDTIWAFPVARMPECEVFRV